MKAHLCTGLWRTYAAVEKLYNEKVPRSRTFVSRSEKAVKLDTVGSKRSKLRNAVLYRPIETRMYPEGSIVLRLYDTDVVVYQPDGYVMINTGGYNTPTTFERISTACGVVVSSGSGITTFSTRLYLAESREGKAPGNMLRSVPFIDGVRVHLATGEIHPEDVAKTPSDRRKKYGAPNAVAKRRHKELWARIEPQLKFSLGLGAWGAQPLGWSMRRDKLVELLLNDPSYVPTDTELEGVYTASHDGLEYLDHDVRRDVLRDYLPTFKRNLLDGVARALHEYETKGGQVLGGGYYVAPQDMGGVK